MLAILPNGSRCRFMSYSMDPKALEGAELDLCWCDELVPPDFLETLRFRLATRGGRKAWKAFHDEFLSYGGPPIPLVRKAMMGEAKASAAF